MVFFNWAVENPLGNDSRSCRNCNKFVFRFYYMLVKGVPMVTL